MHNALLHKRQEAITDLRKNLNGFLFRNDFMVLFFEIVFQIDVTELLDDVIIVITFHHIEELDNVG